MAEASSQRADDSEEMKIVIESLYDTFVKYLNPEVIIDNDSWIREHKGDFVQIQSSRETAVQNLIGWILDDDDVCETAINHFTATLKMLTSDSDTLHPAIIGGTDEEKLQMSQNMKSLVYILDGSLIQKLSMHDMVNVLNVMLDNKIITEKICKQAKEFESPHKCCMKMLQNIKKGKPDWPLVYFSALMKTNPSLLQPFTFGPAQPVSQITLTTHSEIDNNKEFTSAEITTAKTSIGLSEIPVGLSEILDDAPDLSSSFSSLVYMSKEQKESSEIQFLLNIGNIDANAITSDPKFENQNRRRLVSSSEGSDEEDCECNSIVADHEETPALHLREYQKELAEKALKGRNTIICAPTGSGKTRVATHIILSHLQDKVSKQIKTTGDEDESTADNKKRKVAFLARTVPLVMQQCKSLKKYLPKHFEVTSLTGDSEDSMHLHMILPDNDVIVMTPRILENHLKKGCLPHLGVFSMLIFDECHHTRKGEPYNTLMYSYLNTKKQINDMKEKGETTDIKLPQIVGLTASISVEKAVKDEEAVECILKVCGNLDANSISCVEKNIEELKKTVPVPEEVLQKLREVENDEAVNKIVKIMGNLEKAVLHHAEEIKNDQLNALLKTLPNDKKSQQYGQWAVKIKNVVKAFPRNENRETISSVRALIIIADYLSAYNVALDLHDLVLMEHVIAYLDKCFVEFSHNEKRSSSEDLYFRYFSEFKNLMNNRLREENPNLTILKNTLSQYLIAKGGKSCGIIFVRTRALTEALASWLNTCDDEKLQNLKATVFTGTGASVDEGGMTTAEQDEVLQRFNSGDIRLLVATSVGEEGIDIAECNLVIKYNHVGNEVTTVQTRGRSRKSGGMSILLAMDKIIRKERINQEKAKMMVRAIQVIAKMKPSKIRKMNKVHQQQIMRDEEILQIVKQQEESILLKKHFKMVCQLCRKVVIDSADIRTIFQTHHVVVNRNILLQTKTIPYKGAKFIDEIKMIGSVRCMGEPEEGKHCYNKLGSMMVYSKIPFVVLGIKNFGFDLSGPLGLEFHNQWKKVPYAIDEIGPSDFKSYLPESKSVKEQDDKSDDDDDSDENSGDDDDKGNQSSGKSAKHALTEQPKMALSGNLDITTELKNVPSSLGVNNSDGISRTEPKRLQATSDSHEEKDSGISGTSNEHNISSSSRQKSNETKSLENLEASNITKNEGSSSAQRSEISSFKSDDKYHQTQPVSSSLIMRSKRRIENIFFVKNTNNILYEGPSLELKLSTFQQLPDETFPSLSASEMSENEDPYSLQAESNNINAAVACRTNTDENKDTTESNNVNAAETCETNTDENKDITKSNDVNVAEACRTNTDENEDITTPKEVLAERNDVQNRHSRQNNDDDSVSHNQQLKSGLFLL